MFFAEISLSLRRKSSCNQEQTDNGLKFCISILKLTFTPYPLQLRHTFTVAAHSRTSTPDVLVTLSHEGVIGYGEASMPPYLGESIKSVCRFLSLLDLAQFRDPFLIDDILDYVDGVAPGNCAAKASIDIALHDLVGKLAGFPLHRLWGLNPERTLPTTYTIGIDTPAIVQEKTREAIGLYQRLKVKVGIEGDRELIRSIRAVTDLPLTVDANQGWSDRGYALEQIHWLKDQGVIMIEQPLPKHQLDDLGWLTERSPLPIIADESCQRLSDVIRLQGMVSGINIKLMKCTGLREARKMISVAQAGDMQVMLGCMTETSCAISAAAQLLPLAQYADLDGNLLIANDPYTGVRCEGGVLRLNNHPGIGIERKPE